MCTIGQLMASGRQHEWGKAVVAGQAAKVTLVHPGVPQPLWPLFRTYKSKKIGYIVLTEQDRQSYFVALFILCNLFILSSTRLHHLGSASQLTCYRQALG
jgi:hypothetical protein